MSQVSAGSRAVLAALGALIAVGAYRGLDAATSQTAQAAQTQTRAAGAGPLSLEATIATYCLGCHDSDSQTAGLALDTLDTHNVATDAAIWEKVLVKLRTEEM